MPRPRLNNARTVHINGKTVPRSRSKKIYRPGFNVYRVKDEVIVSYHDLKNIKDPLGAAELAQRRINEDAEILMATKQLGATYYFAVYPRQQRGT